MPERWLEDKDPNLIHLYHLVVGRNCIGQYLAEGYNQSCFCQNMSKYEFKALNPIKMRLKFMYAT